MPATTSVGQHVLNSGSTNHRCVARPRPRPCRCLGRALPFTASGSRSPLLLLAAASSSSRGVRNSSPPQHVQRRSQKHNVGHLHDNNKVNGKIGEAGVRVNKAFRQTHSRREADALVASGRVHVNGTKPEPGTRLQPGDVVTLDGKRVAWERLEPTSKKRQTKETAASSKAASTPADVRQSMKKFVYIAYHKPKGVTCTTDQKDATNLLAALQRAGVEKKSKNQRLFPVGRLDKLSTGLLVVTSDGRVPNAVLAPDAKYQKQYIVKPHERVTDEHLRELRSGVIITTTAQRKGAKPLTAKTMPCQVDRRGDDLCFTLEEGRNRQIRRMLEALGYRTLALHRPSFAGLKLHGRTAAPGGWALLEGDELDVVAKWLK